jgi:hypothetical protein
MTAAPSWRSRFVAGEVEHASKSAWPLKGQTASTRSLAPPKRPTASAKAKDYFQKLTALASTDAPQTNHELQTASALRRLPYAKGRCAGSHGPACHMDDADRQGVDRPFVDQSLRPRSIKRIESR